MMDHAITFVSVIIPVLNGELTIRECLVSLLRMDFPPERREILVVDNGSRDRTAEIVNSFPVRYVREERRGRSHARNKGIETSRGDILAFTDADCVVSTGWLRELVRGFESRDVGASVGEIIAYPPHTPAERYIAMRKPLWQQRTLAYPDSPWFLTGCAAVRREVFDQLGGFDPRFARVGCEDIDFSWRFFRDKDFKLSFHPKAVVFHHHRVTTSGLFRQYMSYGHGQAILCRKYPDELHWTWQKELGAYKDLFRTGLSLGRAAIRARMDIKKEKEVSYLYLELVRKLGGRLGFTRGFLRNSHNGY